jgi:hypothetical protein
MLPEITHVIATIINNCPDGRQISVKEAVSAALESQPTSYGLTTEYALRRYRALRRGSLRITNPHSRALWDEIRQRVENRLAHHPEEDDFSALDYVISNVTPSRYFLSPKYAEKQFYKHTHHNRKPRSL